MALKVVYIVDAEDLSGVVLLDIDDGLAERCDAVRVKHTCEVD